MEPLCLVVFFLLIPGSMDSAPVSGTSSWTGPDHELQCLMEVPEGAEVLVLEWTHLDRHVLLHRDSRVTVGRAFKNRVELRDPEHRSGDMSIRLKNISTEDSGEYKCKAGIKNSGGTKPLSQVIHLTVKPVEQIVAQSGEDQELPCAFPLEGATVLRWTRQGSDGHVLWYKDGKLQDEHQNQTFRNRVELRDPELRSGNITLKNISTEDSGWFKCEALFQTRDARQEEVIQSVHLTLKPETEPAVQGPAWPVHVGWVTLLLIAAGGVTAFYFLWECNKRKCQTRCGAELVQSEENPVGRRTSFKGPALPQSKLNSLGRKDSAGESLLDDSKLFPL